MERLTYVTKNGEVLFRPENFPEDKGLTITQLAENEKYKALEEIAERLANREQYCELLEDELKQYRDLEEQGLLLRLSCKVGDTVYYISEGFIEPCTVEVIFLANYTDKDGNHSYMAEIHYDREDCPYVSTEIYFTDIGKTVFFTQAEAEEKLKELEE